jgi:hypothetical protein
MHLMLLAAAGLACTGCSIGTTGSNGAHLVQLGSSLGLLVPLVPLVAPPGSAFGINNGLWPSVPILVGNATLVVSQHVYV